MYATLNSVGASLGPVRDCINSQRAPKSCHHVFFCNYAPSFTFTNSFPKKCIGGVLQLVIDEELFENEEPQLSISSLEQTIVEASPVERNEDHLLHDLDGGLKDETESTSNSKKSSMNNTSNSKKSTMNNTSNSKKSSMNKDYIEIQRRKKIGLANKGKTPWNKGRKHSAETRERIRKRTIEALRDPKVRKKMSESHRSHSDQSKARIGIALRRIWGARLKHRRLQEKCYSTWAGTIAEMAKNGGHDQQELEWDSHRKMKAEIMFQYIQSKADKAREKEIAKLRAERVAKANTDKMARLSLERKEEQNVRVRELKKGASKRPAADKGLFNSKSLKLKARLTKLHRKKESEGLNSKLAIRVGAQPIIEKWDPEFIKREKVQREVSLADQIRVAKNRKTEIVKEVLMTTSCDSPLDEKAGDF